MCKVEDGILSDLGELSTYLGLETPNRSGIVDNRGRVHHTITINVQMHSDAAILHSTVFEDNNGAISLAERSHHEQSISW